MCAMCDEEIMISECFDKDGYTYACVLSWDFDNWCLEGYFRVYGDVSPSEIESLYLGNSSDLLECSDEELELFSE